MEQITWDRVKDALIDDFCMTYCKEEAEDYHCPGHTCPVWKILSPPKLELIEDGEMNKIMVDWGYGYTAVLKTAQAQLAADWKAIEE